MVKREPPQKLDARAHKVEPDRSKKSSETAFSWNKRTIKTVLFREKIRSSWMITAILAGFIAGIGLSLLPQANLFFGEIPLIFAGILAVLVLISRLKFAIFLAIFAGMILGINRGLPAQGDLSSWQNVIGKNANITAKVEQDPGLGASGATSLYLTDIVLGGREMPGTMYVSLFTKGQKISRSDEVEISGKISAGFGSFVASMRYGSLDGITENTGADPAREARDFFGENLRKTMPSPASDLGMGILAGQKTALPSAVSAAFITVSLTHIVVASGYNLTILIRFARRLFAKISRFSGLVFGTILVVLFANVTGFSPSMFRASLVAIMSLFAWYYGRKFHPVALLIMTAAVTVFVNPTYLWGDAGWWMSFTSFAGVLIFAPLIKDFFWGNEKDFREKPKIIKHIKTFLFRGKFSKIQKSEQVEKKHSIRGIVIETFSAQLLSAPVIALAMGQFSPYGLISNLLVLPVVPLAMALTFVAGIGGFLLPEFIAKIVAWPATQLLNYIISVAGWVSEFPGAEQKVEFGLWHAAASFAIIFVIIIILKKKTRHNFYSDNLVE